MVDIIAYGSGSEQFGELSVPDGSESRPLIVLIHGGFWREQYRLDLMHALSSALHDRGYATWNIEYRRVGATGGGFPATLDDVAAGVDHLAHGRWKAMAVVGHSAGGHLALWNAGRTDAPMRPVLTIGLAPVTDVIGANRNGVGRDATANFFGGDYAEVPERYHRGQPVPADFAGRVVLIHGDQDDNVPLAQSTRFESHVDRVVVLEGADHFDVIDPTHRCWEIGLDELDAVEI